MGEVRYVVGGVGECDGRGGGVWKGWVSVGGGVWKGPHLRSGCLYIYLQLTLNGRKWRESCVHSFVHVCL